MTLEIALSHRFPGASVEVEFAVPPGVTALFGPSGAGKSTVLQAVAGLIRPDRARIALNGQALDGLPPHRRRIAMVFQEARLFPHLSVRANLTYGQRWAPPGGPALPEVVTLLGLSALLDRPPLTLSGGEAQRVAIGRALLSHPRALLMDEPLSALDAPRKAEILPWLETLAARDLPILYVSHSMAEIARLAQRLVVIDRGRVVASGRLEDLLSDPGLAPLIGGGDVGSVIEAVVAETAPDGLTRLQTEGGALWLPVRAAPGTRLRLRLGAQDILISRDAPLGLSALNILQARLLRLEPDGPSVLLQLQMGEARFLARITQRSARALQLAPGDAVHAIVKTVALARES